MIPQIILEDLETEKRICSFEDWGLVLGNKEISIPQAKTNYIDIAGADGSLDLTEATGEIKYNDRTARFPFTLKDSFMDLPSKISEIANDIHGRKFKIFVYDDLDFYYVGRVSINEFKTSKAKGAITLEATLEPYKYKSNVTSYTYEINGSQTIYGSNLRKRVVPTITVDSEMEIVFKGNKYVVSEGSYEILNIYFDKGNYEMTVTGNGTFKITYQEASI